MLSGLGASAAGSYSRASGGLGRRVELVALLGDDAGRTRPSGRANDCAATWAAFIGHVRPVVGINPGTGHRAMRRGTSEC